jgi:hypothetical protein
MYLASQAFQAAQISSLASVMTKIQVLDQNENVVQEIVDRVEDGSIQVDKTSKDVRRTLQQLKLDNSKGLLQVSWPNGIWLGTRIKVFTGFQIAPGVTEYVPQGVFILRKPQITSTPTESKIILNGSDKASLLNGDPGGRLVDTLVIQQGTNVGTAIKTIAQMGGVTQFNFVPCPYTVPYTMTFQVGDTLWKAISTLAWSISWQVFFDRNGFLVFRPQPNYATLAPAATFTTEDDVTPAGGQSVAEYDFLTPNQPVPVVRVIPASAGGNPYMGTQKTIDDTGGYASNHIVVIGGSAQTATVRAEAIDSSPDSPTSTVNLGQDRVRVIQDPTITTVELAQARANYELQNTVIAAESQTITVVPNYLLDEEDVIVLNDPTVGAINKKYVVVKMTIPLRWDGTMTMEAWESRDVLAQNNLEQVNGP